MRKILKTDDSLWQDISEIEQDAITGGKQNAVAIAFSPIARAADKSGIRYPVIVRFDSPKPSFPTCPNPEDAAPGC
jgi:hypothetical protein